MSFLIKRDCCLKTKKNKVKNEKVTEVKWLTIEQARIPIEVLNRKRIYTPKKYPNKVFVIPIKK